MGMQNPSKGVTMRTTMVVLAVSCLSLAAPRAQAQSGQRHGGLWVEAGLGHGTMSVSCDSACFSGSRTGGTAGFVEIAAVDQHFRMGGALHVWWHSGAPDFTSSASASQRLTNIGAVLDYYPATGGAGRGGFFLGGGLGLGVHCRRGVRHRAEVSAVTYAAVDVCLREPWDCPEHRGTFVFPHGVEAERR